MHVWATNIVSGVDLDSFKPKLPGKTVITEQRFNNGSGLAFSYFSERDWPAELRARNSQAYREAKARLAGGNEHFLPKGTPAPKISLLGLSGNEPKNLSDYRGKVTVLEFWATWCPPLRTAMRELQTYAATYPKWRNKVALVALNLDDDRGRAASLVQHEDWNRTDNFWIAHDAVEAYHVEGIPTVYILNQQGEIAASGHDLNHPLSRSPAGVRDVWVRVEPRRIRAWALREPALVCVRFFPGSCSPRRICTAHRNVRTVP